MAGYDFMSLIKVGIDILATRISSASKRIVAQLGSVKEESTDTDNAEWWQHVGFASRPPKAEAKKRAAQAVAVPMGDHDVIIASQDARGLELYGNLADGETCVYAPGEDGKAQARALWKKDGSINLFTKKDNSPTGTGMGIFVNPDGSITIVSHNGAAFIIGSDGSIKIFNGSGSIQIDSSGNIKIAGAKVSISGDTIILGGDSPGAVVTSLDLAQLIPILATAIKDAGPTGGAAATAFTIAATALVAAMTGTKRTTAS